MTAFIIFIRERLRDAELFEQYAVDAVATVSGHDVKLLAKNGKCVTLEGAEAAAVLILQFSDFASAKAWYESPAYGTVRKYRQQSADYRIIMVEGTPRAE